MKRQRCAVEDDTMDDDHVTQVLNNRIVFYADVTPSSVSKLQTLVLNMIHRKRPPKTIYIHICSSGGCIFSGISIFDLIRTSTIKIVTIIEGLCASAGTLLSLAGHHRIMMKNARYMIHQLSEEFMGTFGDMVVDMENSRRLMDTVISLYVDRSTWSVDNISKELQNDRHMIAQECLDRGFIDEIR